jgi:peptidoglycan/xylan/chitin deacetylase (PgdA/CDA1 family)
MKFYNIPPLFRYFAGRRLIWRVPGKEKKIYLTFDDGPHPEATPAVLSILDEHQIQATFFCVGENVVKHPAVYDQLLKAGHQTGNHSFHHLNGWNVSLSEYMNDVALCQEVVDSKLFRPPYGRITRAQIRSLSPTFSIILWSALAGDFDPECDADDCLKRIIRYTCPGSIIVLHDNIKTIDKVKQILPAYIRYCISKGYTFEVIKPELFKIV